MQFDLSQNWDFKDLGSINFKEVLEKYYSSKNVSDLEPIMNIWFKTNQSQYTNLINKILNDYTQATGKEFKTISDLKEYIAKILSKNLETAD